MASLIRIPAPSIMRSPSRPTSCAVIFPADAADTPTLEILAAVSILREHLPELNTCGEHRRIEEAAPIQSILTALTELAYDFLFTKDKHVIFGI